VRPPELPRVVHDDRLGAGMAPREHVGVDRLEHEREADVVRERVEVVLVLGEVGARRRDAVLAGERVGPALVQEGEEDAVVGLDRRVPQRQQPRAVAGHQLQRLVVAGQHDALARPGLQRLQHLLLGRGAPDGDVGAHVARPARRARRAHERVHRDAPDAEAPRRRDGIGSAPEHDGRQPAQRVG
jgi:hypothetical protein